MYSSETVTRLVLGPQNAQDRARILFVSGSLFLTAVLLLLAVGFFLGLWWLLEKGVNLARSWSTRAGRLF